VGQLGWLVASKDVSLLAKLNGGPALRDGLERALQDAQADDVVGVEGRGGGGRVRGGKVSPARPNFCRRESAKERLPLLPSRDLSIPLTPTSFRFPPHFSPLQKCTSRSEKLRAGRIFVL